MVSPVQTLRKLSRRDSSPEHHAAYVEQLMSETNHRGTCIILCANVETALDAALQSMLFLDENSSLFDGDDQFSTFARKIALGYALRIFAAQTKDNLTTMRHLRNAFAHAKIPLTFDTPEVAAVCDQFTIMPVVAPSIVRQPPDKSTMTPRQLFEETASVLAHNLIWWSLEPVQGIDANALKPEIDHDLSYEIYRRKPPLP
jgi:hypothetical protein